MGFRYNKINSVEDWLSILSTPGDLITHLLGQLIYDIAKRLVFRRKAGVKQDFSNNRTRLLFDITGRLAIHGYEEDFCFTWPNSTAFLDSDLTVERMLVEGKTHEQAHKACLDKYDYWIQEAELKNPVARPYLIWNRENKFLKIMTTPLN